MHKTTRLLPARFQAGELFYIGFLFLAGLLLQTAALFFSSLIAYLRITGKPQFGQGQSFVSVPHLGQVIFASSVPNLWNTDFRFAAAQSVLFDDDLVLDSVFQFTYVGDDRHQTVALGQAR